MARANLQKTETLAVLATELNVSVRLIYMGLELIKTGRSDLVRAVEAGQLSLHAALRQAKPRGRASRDGLAALHRAWDTATEAERLAFLDHLADN